MLVEHLGSAVSDGDCGTLFDEQSVVALELEVGAAGLVSNDSFDNLQSVAAESRNGAVSGLQNLDVDVVAVAGWLDVFDLAECWLLHLC